MSEAAMEEVSEETGIDIRAVAVADISANEYNPNEMETAIFETLVSAVKDEGMNQPILVRPDPENEGKFLVVDGEHRFRAAQIAGLTKIAVVVVGYDETSAKVRTLSYNHVRGENVPVKLARLIVDLQKTFTDAEIRAMTGVGEDVQQSVLKLLEVPDFKPNDGVRISVEKTDRPIPVNLMLMPDENGAYTAAMKKAMKMAGEDVTVLIGHEVADYNKAMTAAMGLAGMKLRNVGLAVICKAFLAMTEEQTKAAAKSVSDSIMAKRMSDGQAKVEAAEKTDKKTPAARTRSRPQAA